MENSINFLCNERIEVTYFATRQTDLNDALLICSLNSVVDGIVQEMLENSEIASEKYVYR